MQAGDFKKVDLFLLKTLNINTQLKIREIRNQNSIRQWMYTDHIIGESEHLEWIDHLKKDDRKMVFAILDDVGSPLGVISADNIDRVNGKTDWAYYLSDSARGGLGSSLEYAFINFVFDELDMQKLNCEVIEGNDPVVRLHKKFLFKEEGFRYSNVLRGGVRLGVHFLGLSKEDWLRGKAAVHKNYSNVLERFLISIHC